VGIVSADWGISPRPGPIAPTEWDGRRTWTARGPAHHLRTHASITDSDALLYKKAKGQEAKLAT